MKEGQPPKVTLPGTLYQRRDRWWWSVKLPGEDKARARPLKEKGAKAAVRDLATAETLALALWEQSIREQAALQVQVESSQKVAALKAQFLEKVRHFTEVVESATARAQAEAQARAEAEARFREMTAPAPAATGICDCCGGDDMAATELQHIDSGQRLCPRCLAALRADAARTPAAPLPATPAAERPTPPTSNPTAA
jgi:hypothetical protein